jgi:phage terminase small subunit
MSNKKLTKNNGLTPKQERFCEEYLIDLNATQAAIRAGYSKKTAKEQAAMLLTKLNIQSFIEKLKKLRSEKTNITVERVLQELARIAFFDPRKLYDADGKLLNVKDLDTDTAAVIASAKICVSEKGDKNDYVKEYRFADKKGALELIGKHLSMFTDKIDLNAVAEVKISVNDYTSEADN